MSNDGAPTESQIFNLLFLARQYELYNDEASIRKIEREHRGKTAEEVDAAIDKLVAGGARPPEPLQTPRTSDQPRRRRRTGVAKATEKQVNYALRLIHRDPDAWHDTDMGQAGGPPPAAAELRRMTRSQVSDIIEELA